MGRLMRLELTLESLQIYMRHPVIYKSFYLAQGHMNGAPNETRTNLESLQIYMRRPVIYKSFYLAQGHMNGAPNETRTTSWKFANLHEAPSNLQIFLLSTRPYEWGA